MDILSTVIAKIALWWTGTPASEKLWLALGLIAQLLFATRFIVQWLASERARQSIVPETFWYFSVAGGVLLFAYAIYRLDPVFMLGQGMGLLIYTRNIQMIWRTKQALQTADDSGTLSAGVAKQP